MPLRVAILSLVVLGTPVAGVCQVPSRTPPFLELQVLVRKCVIGSSGSFLILTKGDQNRVYEYLRNGEISARFETGDLTSVQIAANKDMLLDNTGRLHILVSIVPPENETTRESAILRLEGVGGSPQLVRLDRSIQCGRFGIDGKGDYYLLGVDTEVDRDFLRTGSTTQKVYLVHKFSADGKYVSSSIEVKDESLTSLDTYEGDVVDPILERNQFCVTSDGAIYFLRINKPQGAEPKEWVRILYTVDPRGHVKIVSPGPPGPDGWYIYSLQGDSSGVLLEWFNRNSPTWRALTNLDGDPVWSGLLPGRVVALTEKEIITEALGQGVDMLFISPR